MFPQAGDDLLRRLRPREPAPSLAPKLQGRGPFAHLSLAEPFVPIEAPDIARARVKGFSALAGKGGFHPGGDGRCRGGAHCRRPLPLAAPASSPSRGAMSLI